MPDEALDPKSRDELRISAPGASMIHRGARLRRLHHSSLFWRFILIALAVLMPLIGALVQLAGEEREMAIEANRKRMELLIDYAVDSQNHILEEAKATLHFLADAQEVRSGGQECSAFLKRHTGLHRWIDRLRFSDADGTEICSDQPSNAPSDAHGNSLIKRVLAGEGFVLGELVLDSQTGALEMIAAVPVRKEGKVRGILMADISPGMFEERSPLHVDRDLDIAMFVLDRNGTIVAHYPRLAGLTGANLKDVPVVRTAMELSDGATEALDLIGVPRLFVFRSLPETNAILAVGIHRDAIFAAIDEVLRYRLLLITLIIGGSLLLGMLGAESFIFQPLRNLVQTAEALEHGDLSSRASGKGAGEVLILGRALNRMAQSVEDRERELLAAKEIAEHALQQANIASQAKTDFLASMSHEIRTPLNGIVGHSERLLDERLSPGQRRSAELIQVSASALLTVANDVLDMSSIEAGQIKLKREPFSLVAVVDDAVSIVSSGATTVPIKIDLTPDLPGMLLGDEARLRQILLNLLNNAVKFTREGHITARVAYKNRSEAGEVVRISIIDTGIGIASDQRDRLFKRFSQVDPSISREFGGTGLGLAISKHLVELMSGEIGVESEKGRGSTFWIEIAFPKAEESFDPQLSMPVSSAMVPSRILVAEDIEINQELVRALLTAAGHEVDAVSNGAEAIVAVADRAYDLILMDIQMPGVDGLTAMRRIRAAQNPSSRIRIVAMTANVLPQQVRSFRDAGFDDHLGKPIRRVDLLTKLSQWLPAQAGGTASKESASPHSKAFDEKELEHFAIMVGEERVAEWLERLERQLKDAFAGNGPIRTDRMQIARDAHAIVSQAALLGFPGLAELCATLEQACLAGGEIESLMEKVGGAARSACERIADIRRQAIPMNLP